MNATQRRYLLGIVLAATVVAAVFAPDEAPPGIAEPAARTPVAGKPASAAGPAETHKTRYHADAAPIFAVTSWQQPQQVQNAPVRVAAPAPEAPQAPPVPFRVLGKFVENGVAGVFVLYNDRTLAARTGDRLTEDYEVASITDQIMTVRYLPLNVTQDISAGGTP